MIPAPIASGFTQSTSVPLYWCSYGAPDAPKLLLLHGGPGASHDYLLPQLLRLETSARGEPRQLLFYDQRGGGRSKTDDRAREGTVTWESHVLDLERVIAELDVKPLTIVGYSWGGLLAVLYAREAAEGRVMPAPDRMILIDPAPATRAYRAQFEAEFARRQASPEVQALRDELASSGLRERDPEQYRHRNFELSVAGYFADPRAARNLTPFRVTGRVQQSVWESLGDYDLLASGGLSTVRCPTLVVHGREDPIPLASSEGLARALNAELVVLQPSGHVPYVERPGDLTDAIERFLASSS